MAAERGLLRAAQRLAGNDLAGVCATLARWQERDHRELPWLAGAAFSALGGLSVPAPSGQDVTVLERFLLGAETDEARVRAALDAVAARTHEPQSPVPPDARGALVDAVERFFELAAQTYAELHQVVRDGHRRYANQTVEQWQPRLDSAAAVIRERAQVLQGKGNRPVPPPRKRHTRHTRDRAGVPFAFVVLALLTAGAVLYLVLQGWPMEPFDFAI